MSMRSAWIAVVLIFTSRVFAQSTIADFEKACVKAKAKVKGEALLCRCLAANIGRKLASQEVDLSNLIRAVSNHPPPEVENQTAYENAADLIAGFEPNCLKNPKFSGD